MLRHFYGGSKEWRESFWQLRPARCKNIGHRRLVRKHIPAKLILYASFCSFMAAWENRIQIHRRVPRQIFSLVTSWCHRVAFFGSFLSVVASSPFLFKPVIFQLTLVRHLWGEISPPANLKTQLGEKSKKHLSQLSREICSPLHSFLEIQIKTAHVLDLASKFNLICQFSKNYIHRHT